MKKFLLLVVMAAFLVGCSQKLGLIKTGETMNETQISEKNYELNQIKTSYVGDTIIKVNDYMLQQISSDAMKPTKDFRLKNISSEVSFFSTDIFRIKGNFVLDKKSYLASSNEKIGEAAVLVDENGKLQNKMIVMILYGFGAGEYIAPLPNTTFYPDDVKMEKVVLAKNSKTKNGENFELVYTGKTPDSFTLVYREYTPDDLARPAFFQNLTYSIGQKQIRFKKLLIEVLSVDNEKIVYKVLKD